MNGAVDGDGVTRRGNQRSVESVGAGAGSSAHSSALLRWGVFHRWSLPGAMGSPSDRQPHPATGSAADETRRYGTRRVFIKKNSSGSARIKGSSSWRAADAAVAPAAHRRHPAAGPHRRRPGLNGLGLISIAEGSIVPLPGPRFPQLPASFSTGSAEAISRPGFPLASRRGKRSLRLTILPALLPPPPAGPPSCPEASPPLHFAHRCRCDGWDAEALTAAPLHGVMERSTTSALGTGSRSRPALRVRGERVSTGPL